MSRTLGSSSIARQPHVPSADAPGVGAAPTDGGRIAGLDGLRAVAVLAVVAFHAAPQLVPGGFVGVDVFFVLSGFLITRNLLDAEGGAGVRLARFWLARARRILPALTVVVVTVAPLTWMIGGDPAALLRPQLVGAATFTSNWAMIGLSSSYFSADAPLVLNHLWSLAIEEQFYLAWPLVVLGLAARPRAGVRVALALAAGSTVCLAALVVLGEPDRGYYGTDSHAFGLLLGAMLAFGRRPRTTVTAPQSRWLAPLVGVLALATIGYCCLRADGTSGPDLVLAVTLTSVATAVLVQAVLESRRLGAALDRPTLVAIGRRSYGLYLWHWPLLCLADHLARDGGTTVRAAAVAGALALSALAAWASYRWVERPFLDRRRDAQPQPRPRSRRLAAGYASAALCAALVATVAAAVLSPGTTATQRALDDERAFLADRAEAAPPVEEPTDADPTPAWCQGRPRSQPISAIGDSVMLAAARGLIDRFPRAQVDARVSRQIGEAPGILRDLADRGRLGPTVVIGLGTNGAIDAAVLEDIADAVDGRPLVLVDLHAERSWVPGSNATLRSFADRHRGVVVAAWNTTIAPHPELLADDGIHPGPAGSRLYADTVVRAVHDAAVELGCGPGSEGAR